MQAEEQRRLLVINSVLGQEPRQRGEHLDLIRGQELPELVDGDLFALSCSLDVQAMLTVEARDVVPVGLRPFDG